MVMMSSYALLLLYTSVVLVVAFRLPAVTRRFTAKDTRKVLVNHSSSHHRIISHTVLKNQVDDILSSKDPVPEAALRQLVVRFDCSVIDPDEISELLIELGTLSVSVEVETERPEVLNDEKQWADLVKTKSWSTAVLRATVPASFDCSGLLEGLKDM